MQPNISWLDDPRVFGVGRRDAHSDHAFYASQEDCRAQQDTLRQCLDGVWKFAYSINAKERPADFWQEDYDGSAFGEITVPGHIEMAGYDRIHYINTMYPWGGHYFRRPAHTEYGACEGQFSGADYNPVGSYVKMFDLDGQLRGKRVIIRFEGVEQAMYVWLNGQFIGYAEDTFTPTEFDLTDAVREEGNILAVEVHKRSTAAYLEDQDFFRFFGIFRSVNLFGLPKVHMDDLYLHPVLDLETQTGHVKAEMKFSAEGAPAGRATVRVMKDGEVLAGAETAIAEKAVVEFDMPGKVLVWDHHHPELYTLEVEIADENGVIVEVCPQEFGFRRIELKDKLVLLNGKRLIINGVNRHEWNARSGRCITDADEEWDIAYFLRNNINAVRTCHYPDRLVHYEGVVNNRVYEDVISDVESRMYATPAAIREYLTNNPKKPFILCEYMHDMGNSLGGLGSYYQLVDEFPMMQGGYIWDYIDQALFVYDEVTGREVLRYGGDFDDRPSDYEFSGNGIVFADRTEKPATQEVRYYYGLHDE